MEVVSIDGVEYQKASQVAKQFKYTSDYVGQLCRGKKIDAKLIGRTWYVNPLSLKTHKKGLYTKDAANEKTPKIKSKDEISRLDVEPVVRRSTVKVLPKSSTNSNFAKRIDWKPAKYVEDTNELLPVLGRVDVFGSRIKVDMADSEKLVLKNNKNVTYLEAEELPEISLTGSLKIASYDDDFHDDTPEKTLNSIDISEESEDEKFEEDDREEVRVKVIEKDRAEKVKVRTGSKREAQPEISEKEAVYSVNISKGAFPRSFTPATVARASKGKFSGESSSVEEVVSGAPKWPWVLVCIFAVVLFSAVLFLEQSISTTAEIYEWGLIISSPNFELDFLSNFTKSY